MALSAFPAAFCDSGAVLDTLAQDGLAKDCRILTASPFLHAALGQRSEFVRDRMARARLAEILAARLELQTRALQAAETTPAIRDFAGVVTLRLLTSLDFLVLAGCLTRADCEEPRLIARAMTGNAAADEVYNGPWPALLAGNPEARVREVAIPVTGLDAAAPNTSGRLLDRLRVAGTRRAAFRAICALGPLWPHRVRREALILSENELLHETAFSLALRGWALRRVKLTGTPASLDETETRALTSVCAEVLHTYCARWVVEPVRAPLVAMITDQVLAGARDQKSGASAFARVAADGTTARSRILLANFPAKPAIAGAWQVARRQGIPLFAFQHGVSSEICETQDATIATKEVMCSDRAYTFNERATAVANAISARRGVSIPVGMPGDMRRMGAGRHPWAKRLASIAFVSTAVYSGYWGRLAYGTRTDSGMLAFELEMIRGVLAGLGHDVLYKRYPALRLLDPDPAQAAARSAPNIRVFSDFVDFRYLAAACEVLVTARATSTLSWCLMSQRPLVFVEIDDDMRLRDEARRDFDAGLFLFSTAWPDWKETLRAFLDQPLSSIRDAWESKADARKALIQRYFDMGGPAGARAARDIARMMAGIQPVTTDARVAAPESKVR